MFLLVLSSFREGILKLAIFEEFNLSNRQISSLKNVKPKIDITIQLSGIKCLKHFAERVEIREISALFIPTSFASLSRTNKKVKITKYCYNLLSKLLPLRGRVQIIVIKSRIYSLRNIFAIF